MPGAPQTRPTPFSPTPLAHDDKVGGAPEGTAEPRKQVHAELNMPASSEPNTIVLPPGTTFHCHEAQILCSPTIILANQSDKISDIFKLIPTQAPPKGSAQAHKQAHPALNLSAAAESQTIVLPPGTTVHCNGAQLIIDQTRKKQDDESEGLIGLLLVLLIFAGFMLYLRW